jgi:hypothetical protein
MLANNGRIDKEIGPMSIFIGKYQELLNLDIIETVAYDTTFGLPWLKRHDPDISYREVTIKFRNCKCIPKVEI